MIKDVKKIFYKTLGRMILSFELFETVIIDIEKYLNNCFLIYFESDRGEE